MKCRNCGAELSPQDKFCGDCGAPRPEAPAPVVEAQHPQAQPPPPPIFAAPQPEAPPPGKRSRRKWVAIGCLGLLAVACVLATLFGGSLLRRLSEPLELTITLPGLPSAEPTSAPRPTSTWPSPPSPTPTRLPTTPTTAPTPAAEAGIELFSCTSADLDCGWETYSDASGEVYAAGPELSLVVRGAGLVETEIPGVQVQDFYLRFVAKQSSEPGVGAYSAAFRCDPADSSAFSYEFELFPSGEYRVWQWMDGDPTMLESGTTDLDPRGENSIEVLAQGPSVSFLVNGEPVTQMTDAELREGPVHFIATVYEEGDVEVGISDVLVEAR